MKLPALPNLLFKPFSTMRANFTRPNPIGLQEAFTVPVLNWSTTAPSSDAWTRTVQFGQNPLNAHAAYFNSLSAAYPAAGIAAIPGQTENQGPTLEELLEQSDFTLPGFRKGLGIHYVTDGSGQISTLSLVIVPQNIQASIAELEKAPDSLLSTGSTDFSETDSDLDADNSTPNPPNSPTALPAGLLGVLSLFKDLFNGLLKGSGKGRFKTDDKNGFGDLDLLFAETPKSSESKITPAEITPAGILQTVLSQLSDAKPVLRQKNFSNTDDSQNRFIQAQIQLRQPVSPQQLAKLLEGWITPRSLGVSDSMPTLTRSVLTETPLTWLGLDRIQSSQEPTAPSQHGIGGHTGSLLQQQQQQARQQQQQRHK